MKSKNILIIAAHPDDEVFGCAGSIAKHVRLGASVYLLILSDGESSRAAPQLEKRLDSLKKSASVLGVKDYLFLNFKDSLFDTHPLLDIIQAIEAYVAKVNPSIVYTHSPSDANQDHRITYQATMTALRPVPHSSVRKILTYEVLSSTDYGQSPQAKSFTPNFFEILSPMDLEKKWEAIECYTEELREFPHSRSIENIKALHTLRGASVGQVNAEAFFIEREISI